MASPIRCIGHSSELGGEVGEECKRLFQEVPESNRLIEVMFGYHPKASPAHGIADPVHWALIRARRRSRRGVQTLISRSAGIQSFDRGHVRLSSQSVTGPWHRRSDALGTHQSSAAKSARSANAYFKKCRNPIV